MTELDSLWEAIQNSFRQDTTPVTFDTLIAPAKAISLSQNQLEIEVPTPVHRDFWRKNLNTQLKEFAQQKLGRNIEPHYILEGEFTYTNKKTEDDPTPSFEMDTPLNPHYNFGTFVVGEGNKMAHAAAFAVAESPGSLYNPLFIYGGVGLGKTHLMEAIGNHMLQVNPNSRVKYVTSEDFTNDYINAIRNNTTEQLREEYRNLDLLLIDDIQFLANKEGTQLEFFNTFNALHDRKKQIVMTSDRIPNEIPELQDRLVSRFRWGLTVEITPPDLETRIAILRSKVEEDHIDIGNDTLNYIAGQIDTNIRELEGALTKVQAFANLSGERITPSLASQALKGLHRVAKNEISITTIQKQVADFYNITQGDILGKKRVKQIVMPRQIAMYLSRELTDSSLPKIGNEFGGKDHTTVLHAIDKIEAELKKDTDLQNDITKLKAKLRS
ncbi:chromosomal replication initiation protein DnaA [Limosilactobacillus reuteri]|uniref:Chromosomal replication initiator protein DnaA n=1 Tax=Limosilactobacillus reuteri TaxID=1598 RepID=A0AB73R0N0_LIMRT|nr:chromosomal replication initiator protein DnaA [Limosilactobacillus reuteri]OYS88219.1 chromosomal replication initiation protein DnaA [Limosilactobacillus reuteri]OYS92220.1 chromosomal replication initiation protein DnaA [Limosilactobacillus reuteri]OYS94263.1 chromosomal replication initiation protein DnaA [Limosilactobacillus reuteri]OYS95309.1 chromosomal replication initiation protein DnaA [Limosilactobacillus reuteri]OYS96399.1 chromosomal replication initiation protein DnaA [Limosil